MPAWLVDTNTDNTLLTVQRAILGAVILPHGARKLLGWFGGYGFDALALSVPLVIAGGGRCAADSWLGRWLALPLGHAAWEGCACLATPARNSP